MEITLKSLEIENFKGLGKLTANFGKITDIKGQNGAGKTSLSDAWLWLIADRNYALNSNPSIRPENCEDAIVPTVTATIDVDGKPITIQKTQKLKRSKPDDNGVTKVSLTNSYAVNDVPKSARDFEAYLSELGVDFDKILQLSHPDMFVAGMNDKKSRDAMRNTLFEMAESLSDKEIASQTDDASDVSALLDNYTIDEIAAMQNATLRKIKDNYGKDGEILRAKIEGLVSAKTDIDTEGLEAEKKNIMAELEKVNAELSNATVNTRLSELENERFQAEMFMNGIRNDMDFDLHKKRDDLDSERYEQEKVRRDLNAKVDQLTDKLSADESEVARLTRQVEDIKPKFEEIKAMTFDESNAICPYCKQPLPAEDVEKRKTEFNQKRAEDLEVLKATGNTAFIKANELKKQMQSTKNAIDELKPQILNVEENIGKLKVELAQIPQTADYTSNAEYVELEKRLATIAQELEQVKTGEVDTFGLEQKKKTLEGEIERLTEQIGKALNNADIDKQIDDLHEAQRNYEQQKANAEKILYQLSLVSQRKNELLEESVNKNFKIVKFKLFDYLKNGNIVDTCVPTIDGFEFGKSTNTGREILGKLDIINGLQTYFNQLYPVFLDGAEALSKITSQRIDIPCQLIKLTVSEDNELILRKDDEEWQKIKM